MFQHLPAYLGDPILTLNESFQADARPHKINLSIGIYFDEAGKLPVLECVRSAAKRFQAADRPCPYQPMEGAANYRLAAQKLLFGADSGGTSNRRIATIQTVGASGALKIGADLLKQYFGDSQVFVSDPSWDNHRAIFEGAGFKVDNYPYYDTRTCSLKFAEMLGTLESLPGRSIVLLHACCHNPTGVDLSSEQWLSLLPIIRERELIPFIDLAYQGFGDGIDEDAFAIRALMNAGVPFFVASSFSKNFSLYGERCGALNIVCDDSAQAELVFGQLKATVRRSYSSPPTYGGQIVATVLGTTDLFEQWAGEVTAIRERIFRMRSRLHSALTAKAPARSFEHILLQRGMFSFTGLTPQQVDRLRTEHGIYLLRSGRLCVAGLNRSNVDTVAAAIALVIS